MGSMQIFFLRFHHCFLSAVLFLRSAYFYSTLSHSPNTHMPFSCSLPCFLSFIPGCFWVLCCLRSFAHEWFFCFPPTQLQTSDRDSPEPCPALLWWISHSQQAHLQQGVYLCAHTRTNLLQSHILGSVRSSDHTLFFGSFAVLPTQSVLHNLCLWWQHRFWLLLSLFLSFWTSPTKRLCTQTALPSPNRFSVSTCTHLIFFCFLINLLC